MERKIYARFKHSPDDFVVQEFLGKDVCKISDNHNFEKRRDFLIKGNKADFVWCELEKYNMDHFHVLRILAKSLGKGFNEIGYAGIKDRYAWTCQRISIFNPDLNLLKGFSHNKILLKNFEWRGRKIRLGYLDGNEFRIVLRDIDFKELSRVFKKIQRSKYFPNYFGGQRFGYRNNNFEIGLLILKRKFKEAVWKMLTEVCDVESEDVREARKRLAEERDFGRAYDYFPRRLRLERELLFYLKKREDYAAALRNCERRNVLMFVHAVQSKIFNEVLEECERKGILRREQKLPLVGYKTKYNGKEVNLVLDRVLKKYGLKKEDFRIKEVSYLSVKGSFRRAFAKVENLSLEMADDEIFKGSKKLILDFRLYKGSYANVFLSQFFELSEK